MSTSESRRQAMKNYYDEHREDILSSKKAYYQKNKSRILEQKRQYYQKHKEEIKEKAKKRYHKKRMSSKRKYAKKTGGALNNVFQTYSIDVNEVMPDVAFAKVREEMFNIIDQISKPIKIRTTVCSLFEKESIGRSGKKNRRHILPQY
jgi:exonuclease VII large subunit